MLYVVCSAAVLGILNGTTRLCSRSRDGKTATVTRLADDILSYVYVRAVPGEHAQCCSQDI